MASDDYVMVNVGDAYEKITNSAGVRTTVCKNRFEVLCQDRGEINEQHLVHELKAWIAKRRKAQVRDDEDLSGPVP